jgi:isoquinoline 1-oxidoreductase beta subunit
MNRRDFLRTLSELGGLVLIAGVPGVLKAADKEPKYGGDGMPTVRDNPLVFVSVGEDGIVTSLRTAAKWARSPDQPAYVVAEESRGRLEPSQNSQAPGDELSWQPDTDGSRSMRHWFEPMRRCGTSPHHARAGGCNQGRPGQRSRGGKS